MASEKEAEVHRLQAKVASLESRLAETLAGAPDEDLINTREELLNQAWKERDEAIEKQHQLELQLTQVREEVESMVLFSWCIRRCGVVRVFFGCFGVFHYLISFSSPSVSPLFPFPPFLLSPSLCYFPSSLPPLEVQHLQLFHILCAICFIILYVAFHFHVPLFRFHHLSRPPSFSGQNGRDEP